MQHSILITHRNRHQFLRLCLWSIHRSAMICGKTDYEVVVVDNGSDPDTIARRQGDPDFPHTEDVMGPGNVRLVKDDRDMPVFNKAALFNFAIDNSAGEVITFLDADMLVGAHWMDGIDCLADPAIIKVCYRVRNLPSEMLDVITNAMDHDACVMDLFNHYDEYRRSFEAYGTEPEKTHSGQRSDGEQPYGNSQFSITRAAWDAVGLRYDEAYVGRGFQDLAIIREIGRRYIDRYKAAAMEDGAHSLLHIMHGYKNDGSWREPGLNDLNKTHYRET